MKNKLTIILGIMAVLLVNRASAANIACPQCAQICKVTTGILDINETWHGRYYECPDGHYETTGDLVKHTYSEGNCIVKAVCSCGRTGEFGAHKYNLTNATCTSAKKCKVCGYIAEAAKGHTGGTATCTTKKKCTRCGVRYGDPLGHTGGTKTCERGKICTRTNCGVEYTDPLGHKPQKIDSYDASLDEHWKLCENGCGKYIYAPEQHYGDKDNTLSTTTQKTCEVCGAKYGDLLIADGEGANVPRLIEGMVPVKWNGSYWITTNVNDKQWYNYNSSERRWANVMLRDGLTYYDSGKSGDYKVVKGNNIYNSSGEVVSGNIIPDGKVIKNPGSMYVWIPRYAYKVEDNNVKISWSNGIIDEDGFLRVPAFFYGEYVLGDVNDNENYIKRDGDRNELTGLWVAKFLASDDNGVIRFVPDKTADTLKTISDAYTFGKEMLYSKFSDYGIKEIAESHMMKNSEWQALVYLTLANNTTPYNNSSNGKTGYSGSSLDSSTTSSITSYNTVAGRVGSNTHNIYGIFDMSGIKQFVSGYLYGGNSTNGKSLLYIEEGIDVDKYVDSFSDFSLGKENDLVSQLTSSNAFISRGGSYLNGAGSGIYGYEAVNGSSGLGYRNVILPINLVKDNKNIAVIETKDSISEGSEVVIELLCDLSKAGKLGMTEADFIEALNIKFEQKSPDKTVYTTVLNTDILSINDNSTVGTNTTFNKGINSIKIKLGGTVSRDGKEFPVFRYVENSSGKILINSSFKILDSSNKEFLVKNISLGTAEIDVTPDIANKEKNNIPITGIEVEQVPYKMVDSTDFIGGFIKVSRANGSIEHVYMNSDKVTRNISGDNVTLTYEEESVSFSLNSSGSYSYVNVSNADGTGTYLQGEKIYLSKRSENGSKFVNWSLPSGYNYGELIYYTVPEADSNITANVTNVSSIEVVKPLKTAYGVGDSLDLRGGKIKVTFDNGTVEYVDMMCENVYISSEEKFLSTGTKNVTVFYGDKTSVFTVNVN